MNIHCRKSDRGEIENDNRGTKLGSARVPLEDFIFRPNQYVQIGADGEVYFMIPKETGLQICKVTLGKTDDSELDELEKHAAEYNSKAERQSSAASAFVSLTRQQVLERANLIVGQSWTLSADNVNIGNMNHVELPEYITNIVNSGALNNGGTVTTTGVPYCWGGYDSRYTSNSGYSSFVEAIEHGLVAGNVCTSTSGKVTGTAVTLDTIDTMDYLVRYPKTANGGRHVILFYNWQAADKSRMLIMETSLTTEKTVIRIAETDKYIGKDFEMKTPW